MATRRRFSRVRKLPSGRSQARYSTPGWPQPPRAVEACPAGPQPEHPAAGHRLVARPPVDRDAVRRGSISLSKRAASGESSIHQSGDGRWQGYVSTGFKRDGQRDRRHVSGQRRAEVVRKVKALEGPATPASSSRADVHRPSPPG